MFLRFLFAPYFSPDDGGGGDSGGEGTGDAGKGTILGAGDSGGDSGGGDGDAGGEGTGDSAPAGWFLAENVQGEGDAPDWFDSKKYNTISDQAQAAAQLVKKLGPAAEILGAPEGDYTLPTLPEGVEGEFNAEDPMLQAFQGVAKELGLSQTAHDKIAGAMASLLAQEQAAAETAISDALAAIGTNAPERIAQVESFLRESLGDEGYTALEGAIGTDVAAYQALEQLVQKAAGDAQLSLLPSKSGPGFTKEDIETQRYKKYPDDHRLKGQTIYDHDPAHREKVDGMWKKLFPGKEHKEMVG